MKKKTKQQNQQKRSDAMRREFNDIKKFFVRGASDKEVDDEIKRFLKKWKKSSQATAIAEIKNFLLRQIKKDKVNDEIEKFLASWDVTEESPDVCAKRSREYARLQKQKGDACHGEDPLGFFPSNKEIFTDLDFILSDKSFFDFYKKIRERIKKEGLSFMKLAKRNPSELEELFCKKSNEIEAMIEAMQYVDPNHIFRLIKIMEEYIKVAAKYIPVCASYFLKSAIIHTDMFIAMSKKGYAFDPDASAYSFLPWPKTYWKGEYPGFKDVAKYLNLAGKQINKTSQSRINSAATQCTIACIVGIDEAKEMKIQWPENRFKNTSFQQHIDSGKPFQQECKKLPDLSRATIDDWWKVMEPMVVGEFGNPDYGDAEYWEKFKSKYDYNTKHQWKDLCYQALKHLVHTEAFTKGNWRKLSKKK